MHNNSQPPSDRDDANTPEIQPRVVESNAVAAMRGSYLAIPGDTVNKATADLPDHQRSAIRKFHAYYADKGLSLGELAKESGISSAVVSQVFRGVYPAKLDGVVKSIEMFMELNERRLSSRKIPFIETDLSRKIWDVCDLALELRRIAFIFGDSQIGKTTGLVSYRDAHNHGATVYTTVPTNGNLMSYLTSVAEILRIGVNQCRADLCRRIIDSFDGRMLLILDEAHRCLPQSGNTNRRGYQIIEFVRELFDASGCGVLISATNAFRKELEEGQLSKLLEQTRRRRCAAVQLPNTPSAKDLNTFAAHYNLTPAEGEYRKLQDAIIGDEGLGMWLVILRMAAKVAKAMNKDKESCMAWAHVKQAYAGLLKLEGRNN